MINPLSTSQVYTQSVDSSPSRVQNTAKSEKIQSTRVDELKAQISKGEYKLDLKATAGKIYDALF